MVSGSAQSTLEALQDTLDEMTRIASHKGYSEAGKTILANIKSTMSDRASAQKSFNTLLQEYRLGVLPEVVKNWDNISKEEQLSMARMFNFFCGMHLVVNMAEHISESLKLFEQAHFEQQSDGGSGIVRLIRIACKAFEKRGDEKSGYPLQFNTYLSENGVEKNPLIHFRGNRFNVVFANGARVYYLHNHIVNFLRNSLGTPNRLLKALLDDASCKLYVAGCKALGLIDKHITGPLWRILESNLHILDLPHYYNQLLSFVKQCTNVGDFMTGEAIPFPGKPITKDAVWVALVAESPEYDHLVHQIIVSCFKTIEILLERFIDEQKISVADATYSATASVRKTNTISERDFAQLDRLIREKPHATLLCLEAHILFSNNKTSGWLHNKSKAELKQLMETARKVSPHHKQKFKERLADIQARRVEQQKQREREKLAAERRILLEKEKITTDIADQGLWLTVADVDRGLAMAKSETKKRNLLKAQLRFRKTVLLQTSQGSDVFKFSAKGRGAFNSSELRENLIRLLSESAHSITATQTTDESDLSHLAGRKINHRFSEDGMLVIYSGQVLSQVPGFPNWFNVVYDNEPDVVYTFNLKDDWENGDLHIISPSE